MLNYLIFKREYNILFFILLTFIYNRILSIIYSVFSICGYLRLPYTYSWFILICLSIFMNDLILLNIAYGTTASLVISYYGIFYNKKLFIALIDNKKIYIIKYIHNKTLINFINNNYYIIFRLFDLIMHLIPAIYILLNYYKYIQKNKLILSLPTHIIYFYSTKLNNINETNLIYQITPNLSNILWGYVYISHIITILILYFIYK